MLLQTTAVVATLLGLVSTWLVGHKRNTGWLLGLACCIAWLAVNLDARIWAGAASALLGAGLAARNWWRWRVRT